MSRHYYLGCVQVKARPEERNGEEGYDVIFVNQSWRIWMPKDVFEEQFVSTIHDAEFPETVPDETVERFIVATGGLFDDLDRSQVVEILKRVMLWATAGVKP